MTEPDVALTDFGLALECGVFAWRVARTAPRDHALRPFVLLFFVSAAVAPLAGGVVHGFFHEETSRGQAILWPLTLLAIGVTAFAAWCIGARLLLRPIWARRATPLFALELVAYACVVLWIRSDFRVAILQYSPAALFLLVAFARSSAQPAHGAAGLGAAGVVLSFVAAACQQLRVAVHPAYFDHNAVYHAIQAVALALIYVGLQGALRQRR